MGHFVAAGILPRSVHKGDEYYYFGLTKKNGGELSPFCGRKDPQDKSIMDCAVREFMEESLGAIAKEKKIRKLIGDKAKTQAIANVAHKELIYITNVKIKGNPLDKFKAKIKGKKLPHHKKEMTEIVAIKRSDLFNLIKQGKDSYNGHKFRGDAWNVIVLARHAGKL